ncbi:unnamed protein product [Taenia asiatica]|uniref:TNFR-Cys domain-containing protein n=1 Tax=Taenia asiatica TaxID=60517 RepID=A0A0R3W425_TAEAS|nr:unnamed protein product [Taenia asiatica]
MLCGVLTAADDHARDQWTMRPVLTMDAVCVTWRAKWVSTGDATATAVNAPSTTIRCAVDRERKRNYTCKRYDCIKSNANCYDPNNPDGPPCCGMGVYDSSRSGQLCKEVQDGEMALCTDCGMEQCLLCQRCEVPGTDDVGITEDIEKRSSAAPPVTVSPEAVAACHTVCNATVDDTTTMEVYHMTLFRVVITVMEYIAIWYQVRGSGMSRHAMAPVKRSLYL